MQTERENKLKERQNIMSFIQKKKKKKKEIGQFLSHNSGRAEIRAFQSKDCGYLICRVGFVRDCGNIQGWSENQRWRKSAVWDEIMGLQMQRRGLQVTDRLRPRGGNSREAALQTHTQEIWFIKSTKYHLDILPKVSTSAHSHVHLLVECVCVCVPGPASIAETSALSIYELIKVWPGLESWW